MKPVEYLMVGAAVVVAGCASMNPGFVDGVPSGKPEMMTVRLTATGQSAGDIGQAVLVALAEKIAVTVEVSGVPDYVTRPVHLYTYIHEGVCDKLSPKPAYSLNDQVLAIQKTKGPFRVTNTAPIALGALRARPHAIEVRTSPADGNHTIFCGNIA